MPGETIHRDVTVGASRDRCWEVLTNVDTLASWITIVHSVEELAHLERYKAVLEDRVGPVRLRAPLAVTVDVAEPGAKVHVAASGRDPQVNSQITIDATMLLADGPAGGTQLTVDASYQVIGKVAAMGGGIIKKKADKIITEFFANVEKVLAA